MSGSDELDLPAYLERIGLAEAPPPTAEGLARLHTAHATTIPFENLDIQLGKPIRLDLASLQTKLVAGRRGGYCFEQNSLLLAVLRALGFEVLPLAARVRLGATQQTPRTHMCLRVTAEGRSFLCDVGFGGGGMLLPLPWEVDEVHEQFAWRYRLVQRGPLFTLQGFTDGAFQDFYTFDETPQEPVDYVLASHYTSTYPESRFVTTLTAQRPGIEVRRILRNLTYSENRAGVLTERILSGPDELLEVLAREFDLPFPEGTRFRAVP